MKIVLPINEYTYDLFPEAQGNYEKLILSINEYYKKIFPKADIEVLNGSVIIEVPNPKDITELPDFKMLTSKAESGDLTGALSLAESLIERYPEESELYRIKGQLLSELGKNDDAINELIEALKLDPSNEWGLLMMGNIYAKDKNDFETARIYYEQVLKSNTNNFIALNNIGAIFSKNGDYKEAMEAFNKALAINPKYPNTYLGLALCYYHQGEYDNGFENAINCMNFSNSESELYPQAKELADSCAQNVVSGQTFEDTYNNFRLLLQEKGGLGIEIIGDSNIEFEAKLELAENYGRKVHVVRYKETSPFKAHLITHELFHLEFILDAKENNNYFLFISNDGTRENFQNEFKKSYSALLKKGLDSQSASGFFNGLYSGICSQIFNTPIDLFIEDQIHSRFKELRPVQYLSIAHILNQGILGTTNKNILDYAPAKIVKTSKIYNLTGAIQFDELYHLNLINGFKANKKELDTAVEFYNEFHEYKNDKTAGEEYELIVNWAEDLAVDSYFELQKKEELTSENVFERLESEPIDFSDYYDPDEEERMQAFLNNHQNSDLNMSVVFYMIDALNYFKGKSKEDIKKTAFDIAFLGMNGINPKQKEGYKIDSIENSNFSGYKTLAYYYVSWALALPEMLSETQLPFDQEYKLAEKLRNESN